MTRNFQEHMAVKLVEELKQLRRGSGITQASLADSPTLLELFKPTPSDARYFIDDWCRQGAAKEPSGRVINDKINERYALLNAYAITYTPGSGDDLTRRRIELAKELNISTRTVINYEDDGILQLAVAILEQANHQITVSDLASLVKSRSRRSSQANRQEVRPASDLRTAIDLQRKVLDEISKHLEELDQLDGKISQLEEQIKPIVAKQTKLADRRSQLEDEVVDLQKRLTTLQAEMGG